MGESIMPDDLEKEKTREGEDNNQEREEKEEKKKGRTYPRIGEIPR